jgi:hypothetical protein
MASKILYDTRDNSILRCQPEPHGSAGMPSLGGLLKSARVPDNERDYMDTLVIDKNMLTKHAKGQLRVVGIDGTTTVKIKPTVKITPSTTELTANSVLTIDINIQNILSIDNITSVDMRINDVNFAIDVVDGGGSMDIELQEVDTYTIECVDDRFMSNPVEVEVV